MPASIIWIIFAVAFLVTEGLTAGLVSVWFAGGAFAAAICAAFNLNTLTQLVVFAAVSALLLIVLRPTAKRMINAGRREPTNADRALSRPAVVTEEIDNAAGTGAVRSDGKIWTARSFGGEPIPEGATVSVKMIEGVKLIVEPVAKSEDTL